MVFEKHGVKIRLSMENDHIRLTLISCPFSFWRLNTTTNSGDQVQVEDLKPGDSVKLAPKKQDTSMVDNMKFVCDRVKRAGFKEVPYAG